MVMFRKCFKLNRIGIILAALFIGALFPFCLPATPVLAATNEILKPTAYTLWFKLGAVFPNDTFSGTIYYMISGTS